MTDEIKQMELRRLNDIEMVRQLEVSSGKTLLCALSDVENTYEKTKDKDLSNATKRRSRVDEYLKRDIDYVDALARIEGLKHEIAVKGIDIDAAKRAFVMQYGSV